MAVKVTFDGYGCVAGDARPERIFQEATGWSVRGDSGYFDLTRLNASGFAVTTIATIPFGNVYTVELMEEEEN